MVTTDFHSAIEGATSMLGHLGRVRATSLVADCGDFFEGSGNYRFGGGTIERSLLAGLYDALAPGNQGWPHHFAPDLHPMTVCAHAVDDASRQPLFCRVRIFRIGGRRVAVTAAIGPDAFGDVPAPQRRGHRVTDPVRVVLLVHHHEADVWVLLSHSRFENDLALAAEFPFLDVIFAGHCHSDHYTPELVGDTLVVKGGKLEAGYALAELVGAGGAGPHLHLPHRPHDPADAPRARRPTGCRPAGEAQRSAGADRRVLPPHRARPLPAPGRRRRPAPLRSRR
ncbi:hypothetical protein [Streptomyces klenkii]|uniref:hypothetical protein n=1 Tax=Streptomyces klenkii TaxID=1420899 RepID=UPI00342FE29C